MLLIFGVLKMETTLLKVVPFQYCLSMICLAERPIFISVVNQAVFTAGGGSRPKNVVVWAVRQWKTA